MTARTKTLLFCLTLSAMAFPATAHATVSLCVGEVDLEAYTVEIVLESSESVRGFQLMSPASPLPGFQAGSPKMPALTSSSVKTGFLVFRCRATASLTQMEPCW